MKQFSPQEVKDTVVDGKLVSKHIQRFYRSFREPNRIVKCSDETYHYNQDGRVVDFSHITHDPRWLTES